MRARVDAVARGRTLERFSIKSDLDGIAAREGYAKAQRHGRVRQARRIPRSSPHRDPNLIETFVNNCPGRPDDGGDGLQRERAVGVPSPRPQVEILDRNVVGAVI